MHRVGQKWITEQNHSKKTIVRRDETSETRERLSHKTCNAIDEKTETPELRGFASYLSLIWQTYYRTHPILVQFEVQKIIKLAYFFLRN